MDSNHEQVINTSYGWFKDQIVTPETIDEFIEKMCVLFDGLDRTWLAERLQQKHMVFVSEDEFSFLDNNEDHEDWLNPDINAPFVAERTLEWKYWDDYRTHLQVQKGRSKGVVDSIDRISSELLCRLEDPGRPGSWDRRGLVMGSVQAGKTANYTGLICKAADAGYKVIIVLAGAHDSLRSQTQMRLNEEFLGYEMDDVERISAHTTKIGVGVSPGRDHWPFTLTSSAQKGDFNRRIANQVGIPLNKEGPPILFVVKKHTSILRNLRNWLVDSGSQLGGSRRIVRDIPLLLIDDECDYASVNTKKEDLDADGNWDEEWNPTATNRQIRQLLNTFNQSAYVGYTATPYANIFINWDKRPHPEHGEDLYPRSFIMSIPVASDYFGPERYFGLSGNPVIGQDAVEPLPLTIDAEDGHEVFPPRHRKELEVSRLPGSLSEAIKYFVLASAARKLRHVGSPHNSMLIHVTRFVRVQNVVTRLVKDSLRRLVARISSGSDALQDLQVIWDKEFTPTTTRMRELGFKSSHLHSWSEIQQTLPAIAARIQVRELNGGAGDVLDYLRIERQGKLKSALGQDVPWEERGLNVIAVGGDKLSRGLTLEGLTVSYYLRISRAYDTLMQMGRWFGYRENYADLCRLFTAPELITYYSHIAGAEKELREELDRMCAMRQRPSEFGLKVQGHSGLLSVTSASKSRSKTKVEFSYQGDMVSSILFDRARVQENKSAVQELINEMGKPDPPSKRWGVHKLVWQNVSADAVTRFLKNYRTHPNSTRANPSCLIQYMAMQRERGGLKNWCVGLIGKAETSAQVVFEIQGAQREINCLERTATVLNEREIILGALVNPRDEKLGLSLDQEKEAVRAWKGKKRDKKGEPSGSYYRKFRGTENGLLLLYPIHGTESKTREPYGQGIEEVMGFAVAFPVDPETQKIVYWVAATEDTLVDEGG